MRRERKVEEKGPAPALDGIRTHDLSSACSQDVCSTAVLQPLHLIPKHFNSQNFLSRSKFLAKNLARVGQFLSAMWTTCDIKSCWLEPWTSGFWINRASHPTSTTEASLAITSSGHHNHHLETFFHFIIGTWNIFPSDFWDRLTQRRVSLKFFTFIVAVLRNRARGNRLFPESAFLGVPKKIS